MSNLRLAASNIGWSAADDDKVLRLMSHLGFEGLEVAPTRIFPSDPYAHCSEFTTFRDRMADEFGLELCSMQSIWRGRSESIFDPDGAAALLAYTREACTFAQAGSVPSIVFGCPRNRFVPDGREPWEAAEFLIACGEAARSCDTVFALEANPPLYGTNFLNSTAQALDYLSYLDGVGDTRGLGINLDLGAIVEMREGTVVIERALSRVSHVHISEPGLVPVEDRKFHREVRAILEDFDYRGFVSLEMATSDYDTVRACLEYLAHTFLD